MVKESVSLDSIRSWISALRNPTSGGGSGGSIKAREADSEAVSTWKSSNKNEGVHPEEPQVLETTNREMLKRNIISRRSTGENERPETTLWANLFSRTAHYVGIVTEPYVYDVQRTSGLTHRKETSNARELWNMGTKTLENQITTDLEQQWESKLENKIRNRKPVLRTREPLLLPAGTIWRLYQWRS